MGIEFQISEKKKANIQFRLEVVRRGRLNKETQKVLQQIQQKEI